MPEQRGVRPVQLLSLAMAGAAIFLLWEMRGHSLIYDEWTFFADYGGLGDLFNPFGDNLEALPIVIYKAVFELFGPDSAGLRVVTIGLVLANAGLFYALARRRVGDWIATGPAILVLLLGAAPDVVAATLGLAILTAVACGLGALLALERGRDGLACLLLAGALASNSAALPFAAGVAAYIVWGDERPWRGRAWVFLVPLALYAAWRLWAFSLDPLGPLAGHPSEITLTNIGTLPSSVADSLGAAAVSVTGLFRTPGGPGPSFDAAFGPPLAVALAVLVFLRLRLEPKPGRSIWAFAAMPLVYWILIALVVSDRVPELPRYQYAGSIFLLLLLAELAAGLRIPRWAAIASAVVFAIALAPSLINIHDQGNFLRVEGKANRGELAAIEIAGDQVDDDLLIEPVGGRTAPGSATEFEGQVTTTTNVVIAAQRYLDAVRDYDPAGYSQSELAEQQPFVREAADIELGQALEIALEPSTRLPAGCTPLTLTPAAGGATVEVPPGGLALRAAPGPPVAVRLRRFSDEFPVDAGTLPGGQTGVVEVPLDNSEAPWQAAIGSAQPVIACALGAPVVVGG